MKMLGPILGVILLVLLAGSFMAGVHSARAIKYDQYIPDVTTGAGVTSNVTTLYKDLYNDDLVSVVSVTSNLGTDYPAATDYDSATKGLTISGLTAESSRLLSITYEYQRLDSSTDTFYGLLPLLFAVAIIGVLIFSFVQGKH